MAKPKVACQLIIFGQRGQDDLPGVLKDVAAAGYAGIEGGGPGTIPTAELRRQMDKLGLKLAGVHSGFGGFGNLDELFAYMKEMDCKLLMVSGVGDLKRGLAAYEEAAKVFNDVGRQCLDHGIQFCYHNHSWEFQKFDGVVALDRLYELTDPRYVRLCPDVYWVQHGGASPVEFLRKHLDRIGTVHFKDMEPDKSFAEIGAGILDWAGIMKVLAGKKDLEWIMVEQDRTKRTVQESIVMSRTYMKEKLGI